MSAIVDLRVRVAKTQAQRLEGLAAKRGTTEDVLIAEALRLLFRETERAEMRRRDQEQLRALEAELGPILPSSAAPLCLDGARIIPGTVVSPQNVRRPGDEC